MHNFLILLPEFEYVNWKGYLYGTVYHSEAGTAVYIYGNSCNSKCECKARYKKVGEIGTKKFSNSQSGLWIYIELKSKTIAKIAVTFEKVCNVSIVLYNKECIRKSQFLDVVRFQEDDFIFRLISEVRSDAVTCCKSKDISQEKRTYNFAQNIFFLLDRANNSFHNTWLLPLIEISTFGSHFLNILETIHQILKYKASGSDLNVKCKNYISARVMDAVLGQVIMFYLMSYTNSNEMFSVVTEFQEHVVIHLKNTVGWLMGSPAGFKLNCPLNNVLGPFYQFHISLWWTFLKLSNPVLRIIFSFLVFWGNFGFSFQVAILADLLAIVSVHMYCIYVYAARLYYFQMKGLKILSRLFIGKKRTPLPGSEHSPPYTVEQLLFGTVSFTILLFLLPTTLIYYCVFTAIRIVLIFVGGLLTRLRHFMNIFPAYVTWLWFFNPVILTCTVKLSNKMQYLPNGIIVAKIKPVCKSWWKTVKMSVPESIEPPHKIEWKRLTTDVLIGNLIYPV